MRFGHAQPSQPLPLDPLPGRTNYVSGRDQSRWRLNVPHYGRLRYSQIWPGIDVELHGREGRFEYDFLVAPQTSAERIELIFESGPAPRLTPDGDLTVGPVRHRQPIAYQDTPSGRRMISVQFRLTGRKASLQVGTYDPDLPLTIDPVIEYATYYGGGSAEEGKGIAVDPTTGAAYVTGVVARPGTQADVFVLKLNPTGSAIDYVTYLSGTGNDSGEAIALLNGSVYVTGNTASSDFPATNGAYSKTLFGGADVFVAKLDPAGAPVWATFFGTSGDDGGAAIAVGADGSAYFVGKEGAIGNASRFAFAAKLNATGSALVYSYILGPGAAVGVAVNSLGEAYVTGGPDSTSFPTTNGAYKTTQVYFTNAFVTKLNASGNAPIFSALLDMSLDPAGSTNGASSIAIDAAGNSYISAHWGDGIRYPQGSRLTKLNAQGTALVYALVLPSLGVTQGGGVYADAQGTVYWAVNLMTCYTISCLPQYARTPRILRITPAGAVASYVDLSSSPSGLTAQTSVSGIAVDSAGKAYVTGFTEENNIFTTNGAYQQASGGNRDAFIAKVDLSAPLQYTATFSTDATLSPTIQIDGVAYTAPVTLNWEPLSTHTISADPIKPLQNGGRYSFAKWTTNLQNQLEISSASTSVSATANLSINANYNLQYPVTVTVNPVGGGSVSISPLSGDSFYNANSLVQLTAIGANFQGFSGDLPTSPVNPRTFTLTAPTRVVATFTCAPTLPTSTIFVPSSGAARQAIVTPSQFCSPGTVSAVDPWIKVSSSTANSVNFTVDPTSSAVPRTGAIDVSGATLTVVQKSVTVAFRDQYRAVVVGNLGSSTFSLGGGIFTSDPAAAQDPAGNTYVVARDTFNSLWVGTLTAATQSWSWRLITGTFQGKPAIAYANNHVFVAGRDRYSTYWIADVSANGVTWRWLAGIFATDPAIVAAPDGTIYLVGKDNFGSFWAGHFTPAAGQNAAQFGSWQFGGGIFTGAPSIAVASNGEAHIVGRDSGGTLWTNRFQGNSWTGWTWGQGVMSADPKLAAGDDGTVYVAIIDNYGAPWYRTFQQGSWGPWTFVNRQILDVSVAAIGTNAFLTGRDVLGHLYSYDIAAAQWNSTASPVGPLEPAPR